jgi:hypothetical protein
MAWEAPKTDWSVGGNPGPGDFNRIEKNIAFLLMQQPVNIGSHSSGNQYWPTQQWITLFTYNIRLLEGLDLPIKVFTEGPVISYYKDENFGDSTGVFRVLINDVVASYAGVEVSDDFTVKVQLYTTREDNDTTKGWYSQPNSWVAHRYSY